MTDSTERALGELSGCVKALTHAVDNLKDGQDENTRRLTKIETSLAERRGVDKVLVWLAGGSGVVGIIIGSLGKKLSAALGG